MALDFEGVGELAALHAEWFGQESDALDLLVVGKFLLKGLYAVKHHLHGEWICAKLRPALKGDAFFLGPLLEELVVGNDECRDELVLVGNDCHLVDEAIDDELRLQHLRRDVLAVAGLEEVLDTIGEVELAVLDVTAVAGVKPSVGIVGLSCDIGLAIVLLHDGVAAQKDFVLLAKLNLYTFEDTPHAADADRRIGICHERNE